MLLPQLHSWSYVKLHSKHFQSHTNLCFALRCEHWPDYCQGYVGGGGLLVCVSIAGFTLSLTARSRSSGSHSNINCQNSSKYSTKAAKNLKLLKYHGEKVKGEDVNEEEPKALKEYLSCKQSPWKTEDLSAETQYLRELAITSPSLMNTHFICSYLKSLRIINKQVCEVDKDLLKFQDLEELTLSVNRITTLNSTNLPRKLKVLELCGNEISSLKELCCSPPPKLQHLGLSHNKLSLDSEYEYLSAEFWPNLISLDLSFNDFENLPDIVAKLSLLPNLKNLILQGNPMTLLPNYRGFTIDSLQNLVSLDDVLITPHERHQFKDISKRQDFIVNDSEVTIDIGKVTGIPNPIDPLEELPEFPIVKSNYFVTYKFLGNPNNLNETLKEDNMVVTQSEKSSGAISIKNDTFSPQASSAVILDYAADTLLIDTCQVLNYKTPQKPWGDPIMYNYTKTYLVKELYALKKLLQDGLTVAVIEEKILSWPIETEDNKITEDSMKRKGQDSAKGGKGSAKDKKDQGSAKDKKDKGSAKDKKDKGSAKDKKKPPVSIQSDPPIQKILGSYHIDLYSIVTGNHFFEMVCDLGVPQIDQKAKSPTPDIKETNKGKSAKKKGDNSKSQKGSGTSTKSKSKYDMKAKRKNIDAEVSEEVEPKHLFVEFKLQLQQWLTTSDAEQEIYKIIFPFHWYKHA
ncbi:leucine-rich repeat-containing protein 43-like [Heterodontus francisci]|uniref:leucine-rich repeat-containing protein 43-like n=1 Tax=Heterodontus francisci TaxID=7792 RepID=UPI00355C9C7D